jgi:hypothetical protein
VATVKYRRITVPLTHNIAIVSLTSDVSTRTLLQVTAAVQKQVSRDFIPLWGIPATVDAFVDLLDVPNDYHPIIIFSDAERLAGSVEALIGEVPAARLLDAFERDNVAGIHLNGFTRQPFALVEAQDAWTVTLSHEVLELLADPWGNHLVAAAHPFDSSQRVKYLVEICDPCLSYWYPVNGVPVSDFYTPRYFDPVGFSGVRYSYTGAIRRPREILEGGYISFLNPRDSGLYQVQYGSEEPTLLVGLDELARSSAPLRTVVDSHRATPRVTVEKLRAADSADGADRPYLSVGEAAEGAALCTAEALYSLAVGAG